MKKTEASIDVVQIQQGRAEYCVLGITPLIMHRLSQKTIRDLTMPTRKTAKDKASSMKHDLLEEFRASMHSTPDNKAPTRLLMPSTCFKGALRSVAVDAGAYKAQIGRLTYVEGDYVHVYGVPQLFVSPVILPGLQRSRDIRSRAILPQWACRISVRYVEPNLREQTVSNLLAAAGVICGIGDWRPEKGSGTFGQFELVGEKDPRYLAVLKQGRVEQDAAIREPGCYNSETAELLTWFKAEAERRGFKVVA